MILVQGHGHTFLPSSLNTLTLKNVLHAPQLIKNLISVRIFTRDNIVTPLNFRPLVQNQNCKGREEIWVLH